MKRVFSLAAARRVAVMGIGIDHGELGQSGKMPGCNCGEYHLPGK